MDNMSFNEWEEIFNIIDDSITILDRDFNILKANPSTGRLLNRPCDEIIGKKCFLLFHGSTEPPPDCPSCKSMKSGAPAVFERFEPMLNKYLEIKTIPRIDHNGEINGIVHIIRDITDRKKIESELLHHRQRLSDMVREKTEQLTSVINRLKEEIEHKRQIEEALKASEKKYRDLYNNAPDMYHTIDKDKIIIDCNETEAKTLGYKKEEMIGRPLSDFMTEESATLLEKDFPRLIKEGVLKNLERTFVRKDGSKIPVMINVYADYDENGEFIQSRAIARDITDLKKKENELKSLNRTLTALNELNHALIRIDEESELLEEACRIIVQTGGYEMAWVGYPDTDRAKTIFPIAFYGDDQNYLEIVNFSWKNVRDKSPPSRAINSGETWIAHLNEKYSSAKWMKEAIKRGYRSSIAIPLKIKDEIIGALNIYSSEPDKFDSDEVDLLEQLTKNLAYGISVIRTNREKRQTQADILRAGQLAALGELAAGVAHEINNPINGIINYAELLLRKCNDEKQKDIAERIIKEGDRIANIVRSLLSFAKDIKEEKRPSSLHHILMDTLALTEAQLNKDGIKLKINIPDNISEIIVQPQQIEQVFLNILSNARYALNEKYQGTHEDKIIEINAEEVSVDSSSYVRIIFTDYGTGIPDEIKGKVMNPFFSTKPREVGTGLGLSISHGIVSDHNGNIYIESEYKKYTKVIVELPSCKK